MSDTLDALAYECPNCCADLKFSAEKQMFCCDFCKSTFTAEEMKEIASKSEAAVADQEETTAAEQSEFSEGTGVYLCNSCGAQIMADDNTAATFCYYCHNPVILNGRVKGEFRPDSILPFQISQEKAMEIFKEWCKKHKFLPSDFNYELQHKNVVGLYVPFWVTDCNVNADMDALGKKIRTWRTGNREYTETSEFAVTRKANVVLTGLPADGASKIDDELMEACEPFDYSKVQPFAMQYLSGFLAEKYDVDKAGVFPRVQKRAVQASDALLRGTMSAYTSVSVTRSDIKVQQTTWKYMLLPVWFLSYKYHDKVYEFAINGQSGKFVGQPPVNTKKIALVGALVGLAVAAVTLGLEVLLH